MQQIQSSAEGINHFSHHRTPWSSRNLEKYPILSMCIWFNLSWVQKTRFSITRGLPLHQQHWDQDLTSISLASLLSNSGHFFAWGSVSLCWHSCLLWSTLYEMISKCTLSLLRTGGGREQVTGLFFRNSAVAAQDSSNYCPVYLIPKQMLLLGRAGQCQGHQRMNHRATPQSHEGHV